MADQIVEAINNINTLVEDLRKTNDEKLEQERKGNDARASELNEKMERIETDIAAAEKA